MEGVFVSRPNRFIGIVQIEGQTVEVHVPNTGRCMELLLPGERVLLSISSNDKRRTMYSLEYVQNRSVWVNIHSTTANLIAFNSITDCLVPELGKVEQLQREVRFGASRFDLRCISRGVETYIEVKGVTLVDDKGVFLFPDAPTARGTKHLRELMDVVQSGKRAIVFFVGQHPLGTFFRPNWEKDPIFAQTLHEAVQEGVEIIVYSAKEKPFVYEVVGTPIPFALERNQG